MASSTAKKPNYGRRLLPQVLDQLATTDPDRVYATVPRSPDLNDGFRNVTMSQMARAVNHMAWWLQQHTGTSSIFETVSYLGLPDIRYAILFLAAVKCGFKVLFPSPRNTVPINISLLDQTECTTFLVSRELLPIAESLKKERESLALLPVPVLDDMLVDASEHYPFEKDYATARWDPMVVLHSSGSTGIPKPIVMNHATYAVIDNDRNLATVPGRRNQNFSLWNFGDAGGFYFSSFPPFHLGGFVAYIALPLYSTHSTVVLGPSDKPSTGHTAAEVMRQFNLKALFCPPNIYEQLLQEPDALEHVKDLEFVMYAGGPLTTATGKALSEVTDVCGFYGSTETGPAQTLIPARQDWDTLEFHPQYGADMQSSVDEAYELVLHVDPKFQGVRGLDNSFPQTDTWHTKDLFRPHATKHNLWRFHGRTDDIIVLSNGEKFNPAPSEAIINSHPLVSAALIVGQGKFQAALLIELYRIDKSIEAVIDELWPIIERANAQAQGHGRIIRTMIAVANPSKPFERAGKGTVVRKLTAEKYATEIEALYSDDGLGNLSCAPSLSNAGDEETIREFVGQAVAFSFPVNGIKTTDDLYVLGLDSLKTVEIMAILKAGLRGADASWFSSRTLYSNPTIERLAKFVHTRLNTDLTSQVDGVDGSIKDRADAMAQLVEKYTAGLTVPKSNPPKPASQCVALTGSTGSLGKHLLLQLIASPHVIKVYCLDRSAKASCKHVELPDLKKHDAVDFLQVDYSRPDLGLPADKHKELIDSVDVIIHTAWTVDFNHSLESFEPVHIRGVRNLVDWNLQSPRRPHIVFISSISSISSVSRWPTLRGNAGATPEEFIADHSAAQPLGYSESKNVAEHILHSAFQRANVSSTILRVGQIAGPLTAKGKWNEDEWVPALIRSSKSLRCLPNDIPDVDWIPVDSLARIIVDLSFGQVKSTAAGGAFYNLVNPHPTPWNIILDTLCNHLSTEDMEVIPLSAWIQRLEGLDATDAGIVKRYPAIKILKFFYDLDEQGRQGTLRYTTKKSVQDSRAMRQLEPVGEEAIRVWLEQWGY
ncbi:MAG: hypothetical protein Q9181_002995 [Wetmoreana brouardii]